MIKRALAAALCLMLVFALLPKTARADSDGIQPELDIRKGNITISERNASVGGNSLGYDADGYRIIGGGETVANTVKVTGGKVIATGGDAGADATKTGDAATSVLWLGLMLLASVELIVRRKRRNG